MKFNNRDKMIHNLMEIKDTCSKFEKKKVITRDAKKTMETKILILKKEEKEEKLTRNKKTIFLLLLFLYVSSLIFNFQFLPLHTHKNSCNAVGQQVIQIYVETQYTL